MAPFAVDPFLISKKKPVGEPTTGIIIIILNKLYAPSSQSMDCACVQAVAVNKTLERDRENFRTATF